MISFILKSYTSTLISVGLASVVLFSLGLYFIFMYFGGNNQSEVPALINDDLSPIAGDDVFSTQLDLARAYLETNNKHLAQPILHLVVEQGSKTQAAEAKLLLSMI